MTELPDPKTEPKDVMADYIKKVVASAPELTPEQAAKLVALLRLGS